MSLVAVLRTEHDVERRPRKVLHLGCPGCGGAHAITVEQQPGMAGPVWEWDGNLAAPTVSPSILVRVDFTDERGRQVCHSFLRGGRWEFLADSTHRLSGQSAPMSPVPKWLIDDARFQEDS